MDIPDEAWVAAHNVADADLDEVVRVAAPHIARSAQVAILREMADTFERRALVRYGAYNSTGFEPWSVLREKADALEAGAGPTEARDVQS